MSLPGSGPTHESMASDIWKVADLLRGDYKRHDYGKVILPFTVLRRMDAVMEPTREAVWARDASLPEIGNKRILLQKAAKLPFYNTSRQSFETLIADPENVVKNLRDYVNGFSSNIREILGHFDFDNTVTRLASAKKLLYRVAGRFAEMKDLDKLSSHDMGYVFEHLIRKFAEDSNETAGEHFTPREVIQLMVKLLIAPDAEAVQDPGKVINILDPACGTGGMLTAAEDEIKAINPDARVYLFGQELNGESWAICQSDMLMSDQGGAVAFGDSFTDDSHHRTFDYMLANPPFGVKWEKVKDEIEAEAELGYGGRFGAGLPRINDGSFLFLQHMLHKMVPCDDGGSRLAIVFNGSPLFTGAAESGESRIRQWILEMDYLEGIVALPDQLFYNTGISTYFWILSNRKRSALKEKVVLLDARDQWEKMRKSLGDKRKQISDPQIDHIAEVYAHALDIAVDADHADHAKVKVFRTRDFGYRRITVERPLKQRFEVTDGTLAALEDARALVKWNGRDALVEALRPLNGSIWWTKSDAADALRVAVASAGGTWPTTVSLVKGIWSAVAVSDPEGEVQTAKGKVLSDPDLRDHENIPLDEDIDTYFAREVTPHVPDAWIGDFKDVETGETRRFRIGYEIPLIQHFYVYNPPRPLAEIDAVLRELEGKIQQLLGRVTG